MITRFYFPYSVFLCSLDAKGYFNSFFFLAFLFFRSLRACLNIILDYVLGCAGRSFNKLVLNIPVNTDVVWTHSFSFYFVPALISFLWHSDHMRGLLRLPWIFSSFFFFLNPFSFLPHSFWNEARPSFPDCPFGGVSAACPVHIPSGSLSVSQMIVNVQLLSQPAIHV